MFKKNMLLSSETSRLDPGGWCLTPSLIRDKVKFFILTVTVRIRQMRNREINFTLVLGRIKLKFYESQ